MTNASVIGTSIPRNSIIPNLFQQRKQQGFSTESLNELTTSIKTNGLQSRVGVARVTHEQWVDIESKF